MIVFMYIVTS